MMNDISSAIDWVGCTTNSPDHAHEIRMKAHKALASLRAALEAEKAEVERLQKYYSELIETNAKLLAAERERCARIAETEAMSADDYGAALCQNIAAAIREGERE